MAVVTVLTPSLPERRVVLGEAVRSVAQQTVPARHMIAVDHLHEGPAALRNRLLRAADTKWVAFLDDDDVLYPDHLDTLLGEACDGVGLIYSWCDVHGRSLPNVNHAFDSDLLHRGPNFIPVTVLARRDLLLELGGFPEDPLLFEDWELWKAVDRSPQSIRCVPTVTWQYRFHGEHRTDEVLSHYQ